MNTIDRCSERTVLVSPLRGLDDEHEWYEVERRRIGVHSARRSVEYQRDAR